MEKIHFSGLGHDLFCFLSVFLYIYKIYFLTWYLCLRINSFTELKMLVFPVPYAMPFATEVVIPLFTMR